MKESINYIDNSNTIISSKDLKKNNINYYQIEKLIESNYIKRISKGIYGKTNSFDDYYSIIQQRYKRVVFSYNTALYLMGETEVVPDKIDITVPREYNVNSFDKRIRVHYIKKDYLDLGIMEIKSPYGNVVKCYNLERTICDIVKNQSNLDREQINKIIRNSFLHNKIDGTKLIDYSKKLKCEAKIRKIVEIMI